MFSNHTKRDNSKLDEVSLATLKDSGPSTQRFACFLSE